MPDTPRPCFRMKVLAGTKEQSDAIVLSWEETDVGGRAPPSINVDITFIALYGSAIAFSSAPLVRGVQVLAAAKSVLLVAATGWIVVGLLPELGRQQNGGGE